MLKFSELLYRPFKALCSLTSFYETWFRICTTWVYPNALRFGLLTYSMEQSPF